MSQEVVIVSEPTPNSPKELSDTYRYFLMKETAKLDRYGYSPQEISTKLFRKYKERIKPQTISRWLFTIRNNYKQEMREHREDYVMEMVSLYKDIMKEAHEGLEKSKFDAVSMTHEKGNAGKFYVNKTTKMIEGRLPSADFMRIIMECSKRIADLLGLDAPKKMEAKVATTAIPWEELMTPPERNKARNIIDEIVEKQRQELIESKKEKINKRDNGIPIPKPREVKNVNP